MEAIIDNISVGNWAERITRPSSLPSRSVDGQIKCRVLGKGVDRPTWIFIWPDQLARKRAKYQTRGQTLIRVPVEGPEKVLPFLETKTGQLAIAF